MTIAARVSVSHEFVGYGDYWGGNGRRWDNNAGCAFAFYGPDTSLRDCVDQWVDNFRMGGDFEPGYDSDTGQSLRDAFEDVSDEELRKAILTDLLNDRGRADYESGALCEFATDCDDDDACCESPVWIILVEIDVCGECGAGCDHTVDDLCADCGAKHYPDHFDEYGNYVG